MPYDATYVPRSAMTIFAHPDDAEFSCGATLAAWARAGCEITMVLCTNGDAGTHDTAFTRESLAIARAKEQHAAAAVLGVKSVICLEQHDCELLPTLALRRDLVRQIRLLRPEVVVCGDPTAWFHGNRYINHPDHRAAAQVALEAIFPCAEMELLWPELGAAHKVHAVYLSFSGQAEVHVDVTDTVDAKIAALKCHASQMGDWDPGDMVRAWAAEGAQAARREAQAARKAGKKSKGGKKVKGSKQDRKDTRERAGAEDGEAERPQYVESFRVMLLKADVAAS